MRAFACSVCGQLLFFENSVCLRCGSSLGYLPERRELVTTDSVAGAYQRCANVGIAGCNWLVPVGGPPLCASCQLTRTRPADGDPMVEEFARAEAAKRRLVFQLDELHLPHPVKGRDDAGLPPGHHGLAFDLLSSRDQPVTTGHADGVITLDLAEGDDAHREQLRLQMGEPYRTLLGHFRHETGHYYWDELVADGPALATFRELFGDERADYADALARHYDSPLPPAWEQTYVSGYATAHPWEDWAETFAHYLHIRDTLQTASAFGVVIAGPDLPLLTRARVPLAATPTEAADSFGELMATWLPVTFALNAVNRAMGKDDLYPFVLAPRVMHKLRFVHNVVVGAADQSATMVG